MNFLNALVLGICVSTLGAGEPAARADRHGDALPEGAVQRLGTLRLTYPGSDVDVAYLPDGRAVVAQGSSLDVWDMAAGRREQRHAIEGANLVGVDIHPAGDAVLLMDAKTGAALEWDVAGGRVARRWPGGVKSPKQAVYSPDGTKLVIVGAAPPVIKEFSRETGEVLHTLKGGMDVFARAVYDGAGDFLWVGGGYEHCLEVYDMRTGKRAAAFFNDYVVYDMTRSPDGARMLVGSRHQGSEWLIDTREKLREFKGHHGHAVPSIAYAADPNQILTGSRDGSVRRWDRTTGELLLRWFPQQAHVTRMRVSPDGNWVLSVNAGRIVESNMETGAPRIDWGRHDGAVMAVACASRGRCVSGSVDGTLRVWDLASGETVQCLEGASLGAYAVAVSQDETRVAAGCKDGVVREWTLGDGALKREFGGHRGYVRSVLYSPDGGQLISSADDGAIIVWDLEAGSELRRLEGHRGGVLCLALSPDGTRLVSGGRDCTLRFWDVANGTCEHVVDEAHLGWVCGAAFAADGAFVASTGRDGRVVLRDASTGAVRKEFEHGAWCHAVAVSPSGERVCAGGDGGTVSCWDVSTGERIRLWPGHGSGVTGLAFAADGSTVVSASRDSTLLVWELE